MMRIGRLIAITTLLLSSTSTFANKDTLNLGFELQDKNKPSGWSHMGAASSYKLSTDKKTKHTGEYSVSIDNNGSHERFAAWSYRIPAKYKGSKITLKGFLKTENVRDGFAGLWLRLDPQVGFNNMEEKNIQGTRDWFETEVTLDLNEQETKNIVIGGLLVGKGKVWIDNLSLLIDDTPIELAPQKEIPNAMKDKKFDSGSKISLATISKETATEFALVAKVWGLLKYHHPAIAQGEFNWDYELFRFLPFYISEKQQDKRQQLLISWIEKLGPIPPCENCAAYDEDAFLLPDHSWMEQPQISQALRTKLTEVIQNRYQAGNHHYVSPAKGVGNPRFKNEARYILSGLPDDGLRLLAVFRYWNMIKYYFPYRYLIKKDWDEVLVEYIQKSVNADSELVYEKVMQEFIVEVEDTHATIIGGHDKLQTELGLYFPKVKTRFIEGKLVVVDYNVDDVNRIAEAQQQTGLNIGDVITNLAGKDVQAKVDEISSIHAGSNKTTKYRNINRSLLRADTNTIAVEYLRDGKKNTLDMPLFPKAELEYKRVSGQLEPVGFKRLNDDIGYIHIGALKRLEVPQLMNQLADTQGIVIDIRNYPSDFALYHLAPFFLKQPTPFVKFTTMTLGSPGQFTFTDAMTIESFDNTYQGNVVILVDESTQSSAEFHAMSFQTNPNAITMGSITAAADGNVSMITLPGGLKTYISGIGVYYPDGGETQQVGIRVDKEVKPTIKGIKEGRDEVLEAAISYIKEVSKQQTQISP